MSKRNEEKIIKETKYCKIISQGKVGEGVSMKGTPSSFVLRNIGMSALNLHIVI